MRKITLDKSLSSKLGEFTQEVELCDRSGRVLGRFLPRLDISDSEPVSPDICVAESERRQKSNE